MPTLEVDAFVDAVFILQIFLSFGTGVILKGVYYDDWSFVASQYMKGPFWFDMLTSIPVSWIDMVVLAQSCGYSRSEASINITGLRFVRVLKPLRIFKMLRVIKVIKILHVFDAVESLLRPPPLLFRVFRVLFGIAFLVHACACVYWLAKEASNPVEVVEDFMEENGIGRDGSLVQKYVLASYFVNTVFTTVGFGDIHATNTTEQVFCVVIMYMGTIVFGVLLSEVESAVSSMRHFPRKRGRVTQSMMNFLGEHDIPAHVQKQVLQWVNFNLSVQHGDELSQSCLSLLPPELRKIVVGQMHHDQLFRIPIFSAISHTHRERLIIDLWDSMRVATHIKGLALVWADDIADKLYFITEGTVRVTLKDGSFVSELGPGDFFGELALLGDEWTAAEMGMKANYLCDSNVVVRTLSRLDFLEVVARYPTALVDELARLRQEQVQRILEQEKSAGVNSGGGLDQHAGAASSSSAVRDRVLARWSFVVRKMVWHRRSLAVGSTDLWQRAAHKITLQHPVAWSMATIDDDAEAGAAERDANTAAEAASKLEQWARSNTKSAARLVGPLGSSRARKASCAGVSWSEARRRSSTAAGEAIVRTGLDSPIRRLSAADSQVSRGSVSPVDDRPRLLAAAPHVQNETGGYAALRELARDVSPQAASPAPRVVQGGGVEGQLQSLQTVISRQSAMLEAQAAAMAEMQRQMAALSRHVMAKDTSPKREQVLRFSPEEASPASRRAVLALDRSDDEDPGSDDVLGRSAC